jgi:pimeloyl-ACP methyl ester carboxylesterase
MAACNICDGRKLRLRTTQWGIISILKSASRIHCPPPGAPGGGAKALFGALLLCIAASALADSVPRPVEGDCSMHGVTLASGRVIPELTIHYRTLGMPTHDETGLITNAVLLLRGDAADFLADDPTDVLFAPGQPLDASQYFLIFPDPIGGLTGPGELVQVQYRLVLEHLGVNHRRLIFGHGEAGRQAWLWASTHPYFVDALVVVACVASDAGPLQPADRDQLAAAPAAVRANTVAIFDEDELTPSRRVLLQKDIARMKNGRFLIYRNDLASASAGATSMVRKWKMILPELLESAASQ